MASVIIQVKDKESSRSLAVKDMQMQTVYNHISTLFKALAVVDEEVNMTFIKEKGD